MSQFTIRFIYFVLFSLKKSLFSPFHGEQACFLTALQRKSKPLIFMENNGPEDGNSATGHSE